MSEKLDFSSPEHKVIFTDEQLPLDKAHDTANRMRAKIGVEPGETGKVSSRERDKNDKYNRLRTYEDLHEWKKINTDVTKKDYELALEKVEEIEKLANEETNEEEYKFKLKKILQVGGQVLAASILVPLGFVIDHEEMNKGLERFKKDREKLADAKTILKKLIKEGDKFGEQEKEYNRKETV